MNITKAVIPVAGYGTRRLPITKAIEKCMLPVCNRPVVDYTVEACAAAGVTDIIFVVAPEHGQLGAYYSRQPALEAYLERQGKLDSLTGVFDTSGLNFHYIVQDPDGPYGTAVPVWLVRDMIGPGEHFAVMMGDDFVYNPLAQGANIDRMKQLIEGGHAESALLGATMAPEEITKYAALTSRAGQAGVELLDQLIEKPALDQIVQPVANISKYLFAPEIFGYIQAVIEREAGSGEYYLTDAIAAYARDHRMAIVPADGQYLDGGNLDSWIAANNYVYAQGR